MQLVDVGDVKKNIIIFAYKLYIMKKQGYNSRLDESLGAKHGKKSQSYKDRRDESKAMSKKNMDILMEETLECHTDTPLVGKLMVI